MTLTVAEVTDLERLETSLWQPATRYDPQYMSSVLSDEFLEFGRSGRIYLRDEILLSQPQPFEVKLPLPDFAAHEVTPGAALITYRSEARYDEIEVANRSSLWIRKQGGWKLRFHQGTPVLTAH